MKKAIACMLASCMVFLAACSKPAPKATFSVTESVSGSVITLPEEFRGAEEYEYIGDVLFSREFSYYTGQGTAASVKIQYVNLEYSNAASLASTSVEDVTTAKTIESSNDFVRMSWEYTPDGGPASYVDYWGYRLPDSHGLEILFSTQDESLRALAGHISVEVAATAGAPYPTPPPPEIDLIEGTEPYTGTVLMVPAAFEEAEEQSSADEESAYILFYRELENGAQIQLGIRAINQTFSNVEEVANYMFEGNYATLGSIETVARTPSYWEANFQNADEYGNAGFGRFWAYVLEDGLGLLVLYMTDTEAYIPWADAFSITPDAEDRTPFPEEKELMRYSFSAEEADLSAAPDVILEPDSPPYNLGGWKAGNTVAFPVSAATSAYYDVYLEYAREGSAGGVDLLITADNGDYINTRLEATGEDNDWSLYELVYAGMLYITPDDPAVLLQAADPDTGEYVINLRSIYLYEQE